jgi:thiaminase
MLDEIRDKVKDINEKILNHKFIKLSEEGKLPLEKIELLYSQEWYIVNYDVRSLSMMFSRAINQDELDFFMEAIKGDYEGLKILREVAKKDVNPIPQAISYTHYLSWLANYANPGEQVLALVVNLPIWSENCKRLAEAFKGKIDTRFLELFAESKVDENLAENIISRYKGRYLEITKNIQAYELSFWDSLL